MSAASRAARLIVPITAAGALIALVLPGSSSAAPPPPRPQDNVTVVNGADSPVPVDLIGPADVQGTVGIDPAGNTVQVGNSTPIPVEVGNAGPIAVEVVGGGGSAAPATTLFQGQVQVLVQGGQQCAAQPWPIAAEGERAVIEHASVQARPLAGVGIEVFLEARGAGSSARVYFPLTPASHSVVEGRDISWSNVEAQALVDGPTGLTVWACLATPYDAPPGNAIGVLSLSAAGYRTPLPG